MQDGALIRGGGFLRQKQKLEWGNAAAAECDEPEKKVKV
jgi:hypothetical protein